MLVQTTLNLKAKTLGVTEFTLTDHFEESRLLSEWYGGEVASFKFDGYNFSIIAEGNVVAELINGADTLVYVKDRANNGNFKDQMKNLISNDEMLKELENNCISEIRDTLWLEIRESNWFMFETNHPDFEDEESVLIAGSLDSAVVELFELIEEFIPKTETSKVNKK